MTKDSPRQTGRTLQAVKAARERAERGEKVAYVSHSMAHAQYCAAMLDWDGWQRASPRTSLTFIHPSGGEIVFLAKRNRDDINHWSRGRTHRIEVDHAWPEFWFREPASTDPEKKDPHS